MGDSSYDSLTHTHHHPDLKKEYRQKIKEKDLRGDREKDRFNGTRRERRNKKGLEVDFQIVSII